VIRNLQTILIFCLFLPGFTSAKEPTPLAFDSVQGDGWWEDAVFYEIFVRSFYDSDGDGIGDLNGIIQKLDYLNDGDPTTQSDLGITGLWLMPIMESPSYHGYDCIDYRKVDGDYGSNEGFQALMQACHQRGIRIILDLMLNHTSSQHPWFQSARSDVNSPYRSWYIWSGVDPGFQGPWGQTVWHSSGNSYYYGIFWSGMPDLNYSNPEVTNEMSAITRFWIEEMGADGLRLDAIRHLIEEGSSLSDTDATHAWLSSYNQGINAFAPTALTVGEIWSDTMDVVPYIQNNELDIAFEFQIATAIIESINSSRPSQWKDALEFALQEYPRHRFGTFITNHDQNRVMTQFGSNTDKAKLAASLLLTMPGTPFIYYGEEIGMTGAKPDELIRTPLHWDDSEQGGFTNGTPWQSLNSDFPDRNIAAQMQDPDSLWSTYRDLVHLRRTLPILRRGALTFIETSSSAVSCFLRHSAIGKDGQAEKMTPVIVVHNFNFRDMSEVSIQAGPGPLKPGTYTLRSKYGSIEAQTLEVAEDGSFAAVVLASNLPTRSTLVIELLRQF